MKVFCPHAELCQNDSNRECICRNVPRGTSNQKPKYKEEKKPKRKRIYKSTITFK